MLGLKKENLKKKEFYESAEVELILFEFSDVITTSGESGTNPEDWGDWT